MTRELGTCASCGHDELFHRSNIAVNATHVGDPIPCWRDNCGCEALVKQEHVRA